MGISLTESEARALRDAIRTDYAAREEAAGNGDLDQAHRLRILDDADDVLRTVYMYEEEIEEYARRNAPTYYRVTIDVPVERDQSAPEYWDWLTMLDTTHDVFVVDSHRYEKGVDG